MKIHDISNFFTKNWAVKTICVLAALSLWLYVSSTQNKIAKFPGTIALTQANLARDQVAITDTDRITIKIMAEPAVWRQLSPESFTASINLSGVTTGTHQLPVEVKSSVSGVQIVEINPAYVFVTLEPIVFKEVPVSKRISGQAAEGMVPGSISFNPDVVEISGAESVVKGITEAIAIISLNGESTDFTRSITPLVYDSKNQEISSVKITPAEIQADIAIARGSNTKTVGIKVAISGNVKDNYYISNITTLPGALDITGIREAVLNTRFLETSPIDVSGATGTITKDVSLVVPDGVSVSGNSSSLIHVTITISNIETPKDFTVSNFQTSLAGYNVESYDPPAVRVTASGPVSKINSLTAADFAIALDLSNHTPNNGIIEVPLSTSSITAPEGVTIISVEPTTIKVKIK